MLHKRRHPRLKRRFACEFRCGEQRYRGIVVELSHSGLFVQTDATVAPGSELELRIAAAAAVPDIELRALVVRRRFVPAPLALAVRRGLGLEILEAPREYGLACGSELLEAPIRLARRGTLGGPASVRPAADAGARLDVATTAQAPRSATAFAPAPTVPVWTPPSDAAGADGPERPEALVLDLGELDDVASLLDGLGADFARVRLDAWPSERALVPPRRLLVTTARLACAIALPEPDASGRSALVAVGDDASHTLAARLRGLGFDYLVHRPAHPEALRLLLRQLLHRGAELRRSPRFAFGREIAWRAGWRGRRGTLVELSALGGRILARRAAREGARVRLALAPAATGDRALKLKGRVVRCELRPEAPPGLRYAVGVAFDDPSARMRRRLEALLARLARTPALLPAAGEAALADTPVRPAAAAVADSAAAAPAPAVPAPPAPELAPGAAEAGDRRRLPRGRLDREVVALDPETSRTLQAFVGRDFSPGGLRIDPHPGLALGQRLRLALFEPSRPEPVVVDAEVARDDGEAGLALRFVETTPELAARLALAVAALPALESLQPEPRRAVLAARVDRRDAA